MPTVEDCGGVKLRGELSIGLLSDAWADLGIEDSVDVTEFELDPGQSEIGERLGQGLSNEGQRLCTWEVPKPPTFTFSHESLRPEQLSIAMRGQLGIINEGAGSVTDEPLTLVEGKWINVGYRELVAGTPVLTTTDSLTTHVEGTDYEVNYKFGRVKALVPAAAGAQLLDFDHAAVVGTRIRGGTRQSLQAMVSLDGFNKANGKNVQLNVPRCRLVISAGIKLVGGSEVVTMSATGYPLLVPGAGESYTYDEWE